jgi:hypothetical protein
MNDPRNKSLGSIGSTENPALHLALRSKIMMMRVTHRALQGDEK